MRKQMIGAVVALAMVAGVTGCATDAVSRAVGTSDREKPPTQMDLSPEELGLQVLRGAWPTFERASDAAITEAAEAACDAFDAGMTFDQFAILSASEGFNREDTSGLVAFAVAVYCPDNYEITERFGA